MAREKLAKKVPRGHVVAAFQTVPSEVLFAALDARQKPPRTSLVYCGVLETCTEAWVQAIPRTYMKAPCTSVSDRENIEYESQKVVELKYKDYCVGRGAADLVVWSGTDKLVVELKVVGKVKWGEKQQLRNYMSILNVRQGRLKIRPVQLRFFSSPT
jgi:GxxExxY protein